MADLNYTKALEDYQRARRQAAAEAFIARLRGKTEELELLSYEEVRQRLRGVEHNREYLENIPLDAIVGSVDRYHDFTRRFLPRESTSKERWARVMAKTADLTGLPPIDVYQIGEVYFVSDGNHRVSVARQLGNDTIEAFVTKVQINVPLEPDVMPNDLIIKAEQVNFLEQTKLDQLRPDCELRVTRAGAYPTLLEHIEVHRYFMGIEQERRIPYPDAVTHWYDEVYLPVVEIIRNLGILKEFPQRTETDLYLWLANHRAGLIKELGWDISPEDAALDLVSRHSETADQFLSRVMNRILDVITLGALDGGPRPGQWRLERRKDEQTQQLFSDILIGIDLTAQAWKALEQAMIIAEYENSALHGLHIIPEGKEESDTALLHMREEFDQRCEAHGKIRGEFTVKEGVVDKIICAQSRFIDLVALPLNHPPEKQTLKRLESGLRTMIRRCPRPILTVPGTCSPLQKAVVAFDASPKSWEALYIAAYIASRWQTRITILTSQLGLPEPERTQTKAVDYLHKFGVTADTILSYQPVADEIRARTQQDEFDLILIGGYGAGPVVEAFLGSAVDQVLRESRVPILICK
jgi:nucleotide-binding universal stress UspA family protein